LTPAAPTWGDIETFLAADGWRRTAQHGGKRQRHIFYEKVLPDGRVLQTHVSHSAQKSLSPGRFSAVLRNQLEVSKAEFWSCLHTGEPVVRPVSVDEAPVEHDAWVVAVLAGELHLSPDDIARLTVEEARRIVHEHWSRPGSR
jgi:hypothetical protein